MDTVELVGDGVDSVYIWQANVFCAVTTVFFYCIGEVLAKIGKPTYVAADVEFWKWRNIFISWIHGLLSGTWTLLCIIWYPDVIRDPVAFINNFTYFLIPFSAGYFIYDFIDLMLNKKLGTHWEIALHHTIITTSFIYNWTAKTCVGYTVFALMAEINSIFLHLRKLLQMCKVGFDTNVYKSVAYVNLVTFVICRTLPQFRIYSGFYFDYYRITTAYLIYFNITVPIGVIINLILFWRLLKTDVLKTLFGFGKKKKNGKLIPNENGKADYSKDE